MKKLYIIRHAKSSWKDESLNDFDRPLNKRGKSNAKLMGSKLKNKKVTPDIIISSPALRAKTTAEIIAKEVEYKNEIIFDDDIYESSPDILHKILTAIDNKNSTIFLFGHNPELNMLVDTYVKHNENIVTCGVIEIEFDCEKWADVNEKNARLISFEYPKKV